MWASPKDKIMFIRTNKKTISHGVAEEIETEITKKVFDAEIKKCTRQILKTRFIKKVGKYKWEVDVFDFRLIIAEIEVKSVKELDTVPIPKYIMNELVMDITGIQSFSNFKMASKWKSPK
jgi:CYTH domain-containing protein